MCVVDDTTYTNLHSVQWYKIPTDLHRLTVHNMFFPTTGLWCCTCVLLWNTGRCRANRDLKCICAFGFSCLCLCCSYGILCETAPRQPGSQSNGMQRAFSSPHSPGAQSGAAPVDHVPLSKDLLAYLEVIEQENKCLLGTKYRGIIAQKLTERAMAKSLVHFK